MKFSSNSKSWRLLKRTPITSAVGIVKEAFNPALFDKYNIRLGAVDIIPTSAQKGRLFFMGVGSSPVLIKQFNISTGFYICSTANLLASTPSSVMAEFKKIGNAIMISPFEANTANDLTGYTPTFSVFSPNLKNTGGSAVGNTSYRARLIDPQNIETISFSIEGPDFSGGNFEIWGQLK